MRSFPRSFKGVLPITYRFIDFFNEGPDICVQCPINHFKQRKVLLVDNGKHWVRNDPTINQEIYCQFKQITVTNKFCF